MRTTKENIFGNAPGLCHHRLITCQGPFKGLRFRGLVTTLPNISVFGGALSTITQTIVTHVAFRRLQLPDIDTTCVMMGL